MVSLLSYPLETKSQPLLGVRQGMSIYDWDNKKVGVVKYVQFPRVFVDDSSAVEKSRFARLDRIPEDIQNLLLREGFILVEGGFFAPDFFILPDQILEVDENIIVLNYLKAELLQY